MKITPENPILTRYLLGELNPAEKHSVEVALNNDPELALEFVKLRDRYRLLKEGLHAPQEDLVPEQRTSISKLAKSMAPFRKMGDQMARIEIPPYFMPLALGAVAIFLFLYVRHLKSEAPETDKPSPPSITSAVNATLAPDKPVSLEVRSGFAKEGPVLRLPIHAGKSSYGKIRESLHELRELPLAKDLRVEELINHFNYRLAGTTSIARRMGINAAEAGPAATLSSELIACPWRPSSMLLFISLRGNKSFPSDVKLHYHTNLVQVASYRLLGFAPTSNDGQESLTTTLLPGETTTLVIEIQSIQSNSDLGSLQWSVDGKNAPIIPLSHKADSEPSNDARFAALVCIFSLWLIEDMPSLIDADIVAALARETASSQLEPDREEFLSLIDRALTLSATE